MIFLIFLRIRDFHGKANALPSPMRKAGQLMGILYKIVSRLQNEGESPSCNWVHVNIHDSTWFVNVKTGYGNNGVIVPFHV